jgi:8-oxo-dGTP diphosphatase
MTISRSEAERTISIVAAVIEDEAGRLLLVRKQGTAMFMLPGGKIGPGESEIEALKRELCEELGSALAADPERIGEYTAPAANEPDHLVHGIIYAARLESSPRACAEIAELRWHDLVSEPDFPMAPLARFHVVPALLDRRKAA